MRSEIAGLLDALGTDVDRDLLQVALTHRSYAYEHGGLPTNERLEFLGDAVLGIVVTETLFGRYPDQPEGQLAKMRAAVVNANALADVARLLGVGEVVQLGRGENATGGRDKSSILADALEAILGAIYWDRGMDEARRVIHALFDPLIERAADLGAGLDWKTSLQEVAAAAGHGAPEYRVSETGPDHAKQFSAEAVVGGEVLGRGSGRSKKVAEQQAAAAAYERIVTSSPSVDPD